MTTPDQSSRDPRRDEVIAGEYVLGVLSAEDRCKVEARLKSDRAFAAMVNRWEENLSAINHEFESMTLPGRVFPPIETRLFDGTAQDARMAGPGPAGLWNSLPLWRSLTLASAAAAGGLLLFGSDVFGPTTRPKALIAELSGNENPISLLAYYDAQSGALTLAPVAAAKPSTDRSLELWLIENGKAPVSLGVLTRSGEGAVSVPERLRSKVTGGAMLAISLEPLGGSPTGIATGPVIASGKARSF